MSNQVSSIVVSKPRKWLNKLSATLLAGCLVVGAAMAQGETGGGEGVDYTAAITGFKDELTGFFSTNGLMLLGILAVGLTFGIVWKLIKRGAKSI